jgi:alcohol dehydrogenase (cytochrome c)
VNGVQRIAVATGYVPPAVPVEIKRAKIAILGVEGNAATQ